MSSDDDFSVGPADMEPPENPIGKAGVSELVKSLNAFSVAIYSALKSKKGNLFLSPFSIFSIFCPTYAGSAGRTAEQMKRALSLSIEDEELHTAFKYLNEYLNELAKFAGMELETANALWGQKDYPFRQNFLDLAREYYGAKVESLDFLPTPEAAVATINEWVEKKTRKKIKNLLSPDVPWGFIRLILTNAVYFKARWDSTFQENQTQDEPFKNNGTDIKDVPTMYQENEFGFFEDDDVQILAMPYNGLQAAIQLILPRKDDGLPELEASLTEEKLAGWTGKMSRYQVKVYLPRFRVESAFQLKEALGSLGMKDAFNEGRADFSEMADVEPLWISEAVHKAYVDVNEEGTVAAAATSVSTVEIEDREDPPPAVFRADHPFLLTIRANVGGAILFIGRVNEI